MRIGAHVSIAGGADKAIERQEQLGGSCGQIFAGSPQGWKVSGFDDAEAKEFAEGREQADQSPYAIHSTYLVNLATPKDDLLRKSLKCLQSELEAASKLGIEYVIFHPGAHTGAGRRTGVDNVIDAVGDLDIPEGVTLLFENTAGKGTTVGKEFSALSRMVEETETNRVGVCLDTCHMYAAGYDIAEEFDTVMSEVETELGTGNIQLLHLNDSKHPLGSEKDEHQHIGEGEIGEQGFRNLLDSELGKTPKVLETPTNGKGYADNIERVRDLASQ